MSKKKLAFLVATSSDLIFAAANVALAINQYASAQDYDVIIYYDNANQQDIDALFKIPHCIPQQFKFSQEFTESIMQRFPPYSRLKSTNDMMAFCHFEIFSLLNFYNTVIWLDNDISIQSDPCELATYIPLAIPDDNPWKVQINFVKAIPGYDMDRQSFCSSIIVAHDKLPHKELYDFCYKKIYHYAPYCLNRDQGIINLAVQHFNLHVSVLHSSIWNCPSYFHKHKQAKIVHFGGNNKIWFDKNLTYKFPEWETRHNAWLALGGRDTNNTKQQNSLSNLACNKNEKLQVMVFGTGQMASYIVKAIKTNNAHIEAYINDCQEMHQALFAGRPVIPMEKINTFPFDYILIACRPNETIQARLRVFGVPEHKIVPFDVEMLLAGESAYWSCFHADVWNYLENFPGLQECIDINALCNSDWIKHVFKPF